MFSELVLQVVYVEQLLGSVVIYPLVKIELFRKDTWLSKFNHCESMTTIYVAQSQTELKIQSRQLQVFHQQKFCFAVPLDQINQMMILGQQLCKAANLALSLYIPVLYFEPDGRCVEYVNPGAFDSAKYLKAQMQRSQNLEFSRSTAESLVRGKLHNSRVLIGLGSLSMI